ADRAGAGGHRDAGISELSSHQAFGRDQCVPRHVLLVRVCTPAGSTISQESARFSAIAGLILILCGSHAARQSLKRDLEKLSPMFGVRSVTHGALFREMSGAGHPPVPAPLCTLLNIS